MIYSGRLQSRLRRLEFSRDTMRRLERPRRLRIPPAPPDNLRRRGYPEVIRAHPRAEDTARGARAAPFPAAYYAAPRFQY